MDFETIQLFPTEIYETFIEEELIDACRAELDIHHEKNIDNSYTSQYYTDYQKQGLLKLGPATELLHSYVETYAQKGFREGYEITHSWVNYVPKYRVHSAHRHGDYNYAAAIVYFDDIGQTNFFDPRVQVYNDREWVNKAEKGKLVIFPAWLLHEMPFHEEDTLRVTMPFNLKRRKMKNEFK